MSRLERLVNLTAALLNAERPMSADELRERIPGYPEERLSFRRQFERDKDALRDLGLPLVAHVDARTNFTRYEIDRDRYYMRDPGLAPDELSALSMAAEVVRLSGFGDQRLRDAMWKIAGETEETVRQTTQQAALEAELPADIALAVLFDAIATSRKITFTYREGMRTVVPRSLSFEKGRWYLSAFDLDRDDDRSFRIDRIGSDVVLGDASDKPLPPQRASGRNPSRSPWEQGDGEGVLATVRIDAVHAPWAIRHVGEGTSDDDGSVTLQLLVRNVDAFRSFVLGFLDGAEVVAPPALRSEMVAWLEAKASATVMT
jgi:proteasome accessory factor B